VIGDAWSPLTYPGLFFVDVTTIGAFLASVTDRSTRVVRSAVEVMVVAFVPEELAMRQSAGFCGEWELARFQGLFESLVIVAIVAFTGGTPFSLAGMMMDVVVIETAITLVTEIRLFEEPFVGIAAVIVFTVFEEPYDLGIVRRWWSFVNDHVGFVHRHDFDLVVGECLLKLFEFGDTARSFGYASLAMKFLGTSGLNGVPL